MPDRIPIRCETCGNAALTNRDADDPTDAVEIVVNGPNCPVCEQYNRYAAGGRGDSWWTLRDGRTWRWFDA